MSKLILLLIVLATVALPIALSGRGRPQQSLKVVQFSIIVVVFVWAMLSLTYYPQLVHPE